jgi:hypothetical protein
MDKPIRWAMYQGQYYIVTASTATHVLIRHHLHSGDFSEFVDIAPNGLPIMVSALKWAPKADVILIRQNVSPLPPAPLAGDGLQVGSRCQWGTSLAAWAICSINGDTATIRQCSGWAMAIPFEAPLSELKQIDERYVGVAA